MTSSGLTASGSTGSGLTGSALAIRPMTAADLEIALAFARAEGWNPGLGDAAAFFAADPTGFFMGWIGDRPVGCISVVKYGADFAFLGLYIVDPEFRGRGFGKAIWDAGMASAGGRTIGLDGVVAQQENYRRSGFRTAHTTTRYGGVMPAIGETASAERVEISDLAALVAYDAGVFPAARADFLTAWCRPADGRRAMLVRRAGVIAGYGVIRPCHEGFKIGPLYADDAGLAAALMAGLAGGTAPETVVLDVPDANLAGVGLATRLGLSPVFQTARMYHGPAPVIPLQTVFATSTLELG